MTGCLPPLLDVALAHASLEMSAARFTGRVHLGAILRWLVVWRGSNCLIPLRPLEFPIGDFRRVLPDRALITRWFGRHSNETIVCAQIWENGRTVCLACEVVCGGAWVMDLKGLKTPALRCLCRKRF